MACAERWSSCAARLPRVSDVPVLATVLHVVVSESLPLWAFQFSFQDLILQMVLYFSLWYTDVGDAKPADLENFKALGFSTLGEYSLCVQDDTITAMWSLDLDFKGKCADFDGYNVLGVSNIGCLLGCVAVVVAHLAFVFAHRGADFCTGRYVACKWDFEKTKIFHCIAVFNMVYVLFFGVIVTAYITGVTLSWRLLSKLWTQWLYYLSVPTFLVLFSAYALTQASIPKFRYKSQEFKDLRFKRTWRHVFVSSSSKFAQELEQAILLARCGKWCELEDMLEDPSLVRDVVRVCALRTLEDGTTSCGDDDDDDSTAVDSNSGGESDFEGRGTSEAPQDVVSV